MSERLSLVLVSLVTPTDFLVLCNPPFVSRDTQGDDILMYRNPETCFSSYATSTSFEVEEEMGKRRGEKRIGEKEEEEEEAGQFMDASGHEDLDLSCVNECVLRKRQKCKQC